MNPPFCFVLLQKIAVKTRGGVQCAENCGVGKTKMADRSLPSNWITKEISSRIDSYFIFAFLPIPFGITPTV